MARRRWWRLLAGLLIALSLLSAAALLVGYSHPASMSFGHTAIGVEGQYAEFASGSVDVDKSNGVWLLAPSGQAAIKLGHGSIWHPSVSKAMVTVGGPGLVTISSTISVVNVPLIPWAILPGVLGAVVWWRLARKHPRGHCAACGYDLSGSPAGPCPECGRAERATVQTTG